MATAQHILVTGGAGFIGSHLLERLIARGDRITIIDDFSTGRRSNLAAFDSDEVTIVDGTVHDRLSDFDPGTFDEIYHLAAAVGVRLVVERPIHTIETNVHESAAVLHFASAASTPLLIASSSEVYGKSTQIPFSEDDDVIYGPTVYSRWSYACSKAIDEYLALAHHREQGLPVVIARFFNTVGPRQIGEYGMVLPRFVEAALRDKTIQVHGDGEQTRCFCDVRDVADALPRLLGTEACHGRVFNVGSDQSISMLALARLVCDTLKSESSIELVPYEQVFGKGFDDLRHRQPDLARIRAAIGFAPQITLQQTIHDLAATMQTVDGAMERPL